MRLYLRTRAHNQITSDPSEIRETCGGKPRGCLVQFPLYAANSTCWHRAAVVITPCPLSGRLQKSCRQLKSYLWVHSKLVPLGRVSNEYGLGAIARLVACTLNPYQL